MFYKLLMTAVVLGVCIWWFLKENSRRGLLTIRAYLFLTALENDKSIDEANHAASIDLRDVPPVIYQNTMKYLERHFHRQQMPMIRKARDKGMKY